MEYVLRIYIVHVESVQWHFVISARTHVSPSVETYNVEDIAAVD